MWPMMRKAVLFGLGFVIATAAGARAEVLEVKVPFAFVVDGQALPAGPYRVERDHHHGSVVLIRGGHGNTAQMFVLTTPAGGSSPAGATPALIFEQYEDDDYRLTGIWESAGTGHELPEGRHRDGRLARTIIYADRVS